MFDFWRVLYVKPRSEKKTANELAMLGLEVYTPTQRLLRQWKDRKKWVEIPLFNSYVFIKIAEEDRKKVFECKNVLNYIRVGKEYASISDAEIERVRMISCSLTEITVINKTAHALIGKRVRVINGVLMGLEGEIIAENNQTILRITLADLGCLMQVEMNSEDVELL